MDNLQYLVDRRKIEDLMISYCNAIDQHDWNALDDIFAVNAEIDYTALGGPKDNLQEIKKFLDESLPRFKHKQHIITNMQVSLNGDRATGRTCCINPMGMPEGENVRNLIFWLWYIDDFVRTADGWRIQKRREEFSHADNLPDGFIIPG